MLCLRRRELGRVKKSEILPPLCPLVVPPSEGRRTHHQSFETHHKFRYRRTRHDKRSRLSCPTEAVAVRGEFEIPCRVLAACAILHKRKRKEQPKCRKSPRGAGSCSSSSWFFSRSCSILGGSRFFRWPYSPCSLIC